MTCDTPGKGSEILSKPLLSFLLYCLPIIAIVRADTNQSAGVGEPRSGQPP